MSESNNALGSLANEHPVACLAFGAIIACATAASRIALAYIDAKHREKEDEIHLARLKVIRGE